MNNLRQAVIKLAREIPETRKHLVPLLVKNAFLAPERIKHVQLGMEIEHPEHLESEDPRKEKAEAAKFMSEVSRISSLLKHPATIKRYEATWIFPVPVKYNAKLAKDYEMKAPHSGGEQAIQLYKRVAASSQYDVFFHLYIWPSAKID
jgi:hypothetical protein